MPIIIAEIGLNHNGSVETAQQLIHRVAEAGADYAKFQMRDIDSLYRNPRIYSKEDLSVQYVLDLLSKFELTTAEMIGLFDHCKEYGIKPLCTPWDAASVAILEQYGMTAYKTASADLTNHPLLARLAQTGKKMFCSTGMSSEEEIIETCDFLTLHGADFVLLHCNSTYPTPFKDVNLAYLKRLQEISKRDVGYSGHERGYEVPIAAVALGATVVEKHITLCREWEGNDHKVSLLPDEFTAMVSAIRNIQKAIGTDDRRIISGGERINRESLAKSIVAKKDLSEGTTLTANDLDIKSPGGGLQPNMLATLVGETLHKNVARNNFIYLSDTKSSKKYHSFSLTSKWGVPVRPHDWRSYLNSNTQFLEFHVSYNDLKLDPNDYLEKTTLDFTLHSPDLFEGDHLLDLGSTNRFYRQASVDNLRRVIDLAKKMRPYFQTDGKTKIIASVGGISRDDFINDKTKQVSYDWVKYHLAELTDDETEIIIQTVPPMPWYFGGQLYLNLFVFPDEITKFCEETKHRICFDVSHSMMACNYHNLNLYDFAKVVKPHTTHLHLADTISVDGEGLQIGTGEIDFEQLADVLKGCDATLIPEIWQGHHDHGHECWRALSILEQWF